MTSDHDISLAADIERAELILHDLAVDLAHVRTAPLHVQALALKRDVARWSEERPAEAERQKLIEELLNLQARSRAERLTGRRSLRWK